MKVLWKYQPGTWHLFPTNLVHQQSFFWYMCPWPCWLKLTNQMKLETSCPLVHGKPLCLLHTTFSAQRRKNNEERMKITVCGKNGSFKLEENLFPWGWIQKKKKHNNKFQWTLYSKKYSTLPQISERCSESLCQPNLWFFHRI